MNLFWLRALIGIFGWVGVAAAQSGSPTERLQALFAQEWDWTMEQSPTWASSLGDRRWNDKWEDASLAALNSRHQHQVETLEKLHGIDREQLNDAEQLNYDLFADQLQLDIDEFPYHWYLVALDQRGGVQTESELADRLRFQTLKDYEDYIARLRSLPKLIEQTTEVLRQGARERIVQPKVVMQRVPGQIAQLIVDDPTKSAFYKPFLKFAPAISQPDQKRLADAAADAIRDSVVPAYRNFKQFFETEYLPACFDEVGIWQAPRGDELYAFLVRRHTTTKMTPQEVHELGLAEVKRISAEMDKVIAQTGFTGTREEFFHFLRTDSRFFYSSGDELLDATRALCKRIDPKLVKLFATIPRMPYGVEPIPMAIAPDTSTAYYQGPAEDGSRAGTYYVNIYKPQTRPKWEMPALTLHEAVPGHHLQISRAMELGEIPKFRRHGGYTAYVEGWGLYSESLGQEMGMYDDPYSKFGQLTYEMWRAVRLVVDTGIHYKHWTRQQAIDFFKANAPKSELDITNEIDRYIAWPGQALAYKVGELKIKDLRARATKELGEKFDLREFHDVVLGHGAVPLDVLERIVNDWIVAKRK
jgi:prolyl oligopeptidase